MRRLIAVTVATLLVSGVAAQSLAADEPPMACTLIGCTSGVGIDVAKVRDDVDRLTFCVRGRCKPTCLGASVRFNGAALVVQG